MVKEAEEGRHPELAVLTRAKSRLDEPGYRILQIALWVLGDYRGYPDEKG